MNTKLCALGWHLLTLGSHHRVTWLSLCYGNSMPVSLGLFSLDWVDFQRGKKQACLAPRRWPWLPKFRGQEEDEAWGVNIQYVDRVLLIFQSSIWYLLSSAVPGASTWFSLGENPSVFGWIIWESICLWPDFQLHSVVSITLILPPLMPETFGSSAEQRKLFLGFLPCWL